MRLAEPSYLLLLWIVPALAAFYLWAFRERDRLMAEFASLPMLAKLIPQVQRGRQRVKAALLTTAVVFALLSVARPQWGFKWEEITRQGVDILVAVDVSQSMMATDVSPNRVVAARRELTDLLGKLQGDRIGLIAFAGTAFVQCPLTLDYGAFGMFLDYLSPDLIPVQGTSLTQAIKLARESFLKSQSTSKALILITDGEDHEGDPLAAAKEAKEAGIQIYTIGIGAQEGAPIPAPDGSGFLRDDNGQLAMTRLDEETLKKIAVETGGAYVRSTSGDMDLDSIYLQGIRGSLKAADLTSTRQKRWEERFQWPLTLAVLLILLEPLLSERGARRHREGKGPLNTGSSQMPSVTSPRLTPRSAGTVGLLLLLAGLCSLPTPAQAGWLREDNIEEGLEAYQRHDFETALQKFTDAKLEHPDDPLLDYNLGNTYYKTRRFEEAAASFQSVLAKTQDPQLKAQSWYNLGNTAYRQGKLEDAVQHYLEALKLNPNDKDAQQNLERVREEIRKRLEQNRQQQQQRQQQKQQQQQQQQNGEQGGGEGDPQEQNAQGNPQQQKGQEGQAQQQQQGEQGQEAQEQQAGQQKQAGQEQKQAGQDQKQAGQDQKQAGQEQKQAGQEQKQAGQEQKQAGQEMQGQQAQAAQAGPQQPGAQGQDAQAVGAQAGEGKGPLSQEEAMRILHQVQDAQQSGLRAPGNATRRAIPGGKPW
ncbi:MAG: VWA domain-containing protein [Myxococcota bacterium]